jgi:hypothetical protein
MSFQQFFKMGMVFSASWLAGSLLIGCGVEKPEAILEAEKKLPEKIDFNYHIKPILSDRCFACHGPDENKVEAGLRFDIEEEALAKLESGNRAIVPGKLNKSELYHRILEEDPEEMMPPPESNLTLTDYEKALLIRWIEQGAEYKPHWSFIPPEQLEVPEVAQKEWVENPIDNFVVAKLQSSGLQPSPPAARERLLRRVTFDLTGLPPTLEEIDAFLADDSPEAYEKVVDRLLGTPAYAERMALDWMDLSRYADSHGYHADGYRLMWPWRDWVIKAFNQNMPYDQFVTWQIAGDMLPEATREQKLATAFHRNHPMTAEGGIVDEEYRLKYVFDRANTTATAFLGLTMECAQCHDHKYDPISQKEYYQFTAFFNNVKEVGMTGDDGNAGPTLLLSSEDTEEKIRYIKGKITDRQQKLQQRKNEVASEDFDKKLSLQDINRSLSAGLAAHYPLDEIQDGKSPNLANRKNPAEVSGEPAIIEGKVGNAFTFDNEYDILSLNAGFYERTDAFSIGVWVKPEKKDPYSVILGNAGHKNTYWRGYEMYLDSLNRVSVRLTNALPHNYLHVTTVEAVSIGAWHHIAFTYDGSSKPSGLQVYLDGKAVEINVNFDHLYKSILPVDAAYKPKEQPLRVAKSNRSFGGDNGVFQGSLDDIRIYNEALTALEIQELHKNNTIQTLLQLSSAERSEIQNALLLDYFLHRKDPTYQQILQEIKAYRVEENALVDTVNEVMIMKEMDIPRATYVLNRGAYDAPKSRVYPNTPQNVLVFPEDLPQNRLGLAQWLVSKENPLTARVTVNRYWQMCFGKGIVKTTQDFGNQGELPSHPELLDWLAIEFMNSGWDVKALMKLIVMSATYRQSSVGSEELLKADPENVWLARGPNHRLPAEMIRNNALAASGLLVKKVGGPSVKPYQPEGLWIEKGTFSHFLLRYVPDKGDGLYRRSLYTFWKRTSPPPSMMAFDTPERDICVVRRQTTSTPMQALVLMNDPQFVEASRILAERMMMHGGETLQDKMNFGFRLLTARSLEEEEAEIFIKLFQEEYKQYQQDQESAQALLKVGDYPRNQRLDVAETAAFSVVASMMMNHDEAYTKR